MRRKIRIVGVMAASLGLTAAPLDAASHPPATPPIAPTIVTEFVKLCASASDSARVVLARADADGWRTEDPGAPKDFNPATGRLKRAASGLLQLRVEDTHSAGETREACGVSTASETPDIVAGAQTLLGIPPALNLGSAATFFAVRTGRGWISGAGLSQPEFLALKAQGRFFSIVASTADTDSRIFALHVMRS